MNSDRHRFDDFSRFFKALGDPSRLELVQLLCAAPEGLTVKALIEEVPISQSTVSQHLRVLKDAGIIRGQRQGTSTCYLMDQPRIGELIYRIQNEVGSILS